MINVLFLDIDGVLNSRKFAENNNEKSVINIDPKAIDLLNMINNEVENLRIVISSTWRKHIDSATAWNIIFQLKGCNAYIYDVTPDLGTFRGTEILSWLIQHNSKCKKNPTWYKDYEINSFVILDDDNDMEMLSSRLVLSTYDEGLVENLAGRVITMFKQKVNIIIKVS